MSHDRPNWRNIAGTYDAEQSLKSFRVISDHLKTAVFIINDGIFPSNKDQGYIVRRLIRRAIVKANQIGIRDNFTMPVVDIFFDIYCHSGLDPESLKILKQVQDNTSKKIFEEENKFRATLARGLKEFDKKINNKRAKNLNRLTIGENYESGSEELFGSDLFDLFQTYGFPLELSMEIAKERLVTLAENAIEDYHNRLLEHQELSRTASAGMFKGGLADAGEETKKLHTAAHLMLEALRRVLGDHVAQKGSNITAERLRFDFSHPEKMTDEQKKQVEDIVNEQIKNDLPVTVEEMTVAEADKKGAMGAFKDRYSEKVKVYTIGDISKGEVFSKEICGGPHVTHIGELGHFTIKKEESSSAGVRRIKAVLL